MHRVEQRGSDVSSLTEGLSQIPDEGIRDVLLQAVHQTTGQGYNGLFWSAVVFSVLTLVAAYNGTSASKREEPTCGKYIHKLIR